MLALLAAGASPAAAGAFTESITRYDIDITIEPAGTLLVHETIDYDFGSVPRHGIFRDIRTRFDYPKKANHDRVYPVDVISVKASEGTPAGYSISTEGDNERLKIGDPDTTITGEHQYEITYRVHGALNAFRDHDELFWNVVGNEWQVPIAAVNVAVHAPPRSPTCSATRGHSSLSSRARPRWRPVRRRRSRPRRSSPGTPSAPTRA